MCQYFASGLHRLTGENFLLYPEVHLNVTSNIKKYHVSLQSLHEVEDNTYSAWKRQKL